MFGLIEIELTRARKLAEQVDDDFLIYLIDMAIIAANRGARSDRNNIELVTPLSQGENEQTIIPPRVPDFHIVH